ncbi:MAG: hypothetical protein Q8O04_03585 [Deltaproteobacteria bacterium]|nr:hypothetical protein [Deltaproteobacteria bacterium]
MDSKNNIHPDLVEIALEKAEGFAFERFAQDFLSVLEGRSFVPVGGVKDGGADGLYDCGDGRKYYQFTKQENHRDKIRKTKKRLTEFGRTVKTIYYLTSRIIPHIDKEEDLLTEELDVIVKIRDRKYIISHINDSLGTINSYINHLAVYTEFLSKIAKSDGEFSSACTKDPSAFVFLQHEVVNRLGNRKLIHSLTDTLILWALSETDPDKGILMSEGEVYSKIIEFFPWADKIIKGHLSQRFVELRSKSVSGREIKWHKKQQKYCLPFETREKIKFENQHDVSLKLIITGELKLLASNLFDADEGEYQIIADICIAVIHSIFEKQGLLFSHFLTSREVNDPPLIVSDCIDEVLTKYNIKANIVETYRDYVESLLRKIFYHGSPNQRKYLTHLSRTYVLLFSLQAEPKIIEYFSTMSSSFKLFLGSDILVKALSERYLDEEDQVARNLLRMAASSRISMYLSDCVLEEVFTHIQGTCYEFTNYFSEMEKYITKEIAVNSNKILIRTYFYAKEERKVNNWNSFIDQFMSFNNVHNDKGREELRKYLLVEYKLKSISNNELESVCDLDKVKALTTDMISSRIKENEMLAYNTALLVHGVYGLRQKNNEIGVVSEYGLKTWWMTNQVRVLRHTTSIVKEKGSQFIMRPEYILNFIAMSPKCEDVRKSFGNIFPSTFGIQLGNRLKDEVFHKVLADVNQWKNYSPGRITAMMSDLSDRLKTDRLKRYAKNLTEEMP